MNMNIDFRLHVGFPKTATTWLQDCLDNMHDENFFYLGMRSRPNWFEKDWIGRVSQEQRRKDAALDPEEWTGKSAYTIWNWIRGIDNKYQFSDAALHDFYNKLGNDQSQNTLIVAGSDETISKPHKLNWHKGLTARIKKCFPEAKFLLTLRNQVDVLYSAYGMMVRRSYFAKGVMPPTFSDFVANGCGSNYVPVQHRYNFYTLYEALAKEYGRENITVLFYEDFKNNRDKYLEQINLFFGVELESGSSNKTLNASPWTTSQLDMRRLLLSRGGGLYNISLSKNIFELIDWYYRFILRRKICVDDHIVTDSNRLHLGSLFAESNSKLSEAIGVDLREYGYPTLDGMSGRDFFYQTDKEGSKDV